VGDKDEDSVHGLILPASGHCLRQRHTQQRKIADDVPDGQCKHARADRERQDGRDPESNRLRPAGGRGGINGAGIARDAAGRGLRVVLCEKDDLAANTSSASSKLIHAGLRYLSTAPLAWCARH
jgi:hypothetical protein